MSFIRIGMKNQRQLLIIYRGQISQNLTSFISNCHGNSDVTLVHNQQFDFQLNLYWLLVSFMIAKPYRKFEAISTTIRSCGIEFL